MKTDLTSFIPNYCNKMDSNKWVPQWKRDSAAKLDKKKQEDENLQNGLVKTEDNFPILTTATNMRVWSGSKKFSDLAKDWDREEREKNENDKQLAEFAKTKSTQFVMPTFSNVRRFVEKAEFDEEDETAEVRVPPDSVWTAVDRYKHKRRKEKNMEEIANRPPTPEDDNTVWPEKETNETCWDERR